LHESYALSIFITEGTIFINYTSENAS